MGKQFKRKRKYYESQIEQAIHEVELALIDYRYHGETTAAQLERAQLSLGVLSTLANHCHFGNYHSIEKLDKEGWLQKRIGAPAMYWGTNE
jgi:hypothetical protein